MMTPRITRRFVPWMKPFSVPMSHVRRVAAAPLVHDHGEPFILARFCAESLDHGVARHGIGQCTAHARIPAIGERARRRHETKRDDDGAGDIKHRADCHHQAHQWPEPCQQHHRTHEHQERGQKRDDERVVQQVERPHAACHLAHRRAGKGIRVPVGRKALQLAKGACRHVARDFQGEVGQDIKRDLPRNERQRTSESRAMRAWIAASHALLPSDSESTSRPE